MKKLFVIICTMALAMTACRKPEPGVNPNGETTDTLVKKYLVSTYISSPNEPEKIIEWDEGYKRINRIVTKPGNPHFEVAYDFEYYGNDSLRVAISLPEHSSLWFIGFSNYTCHLNNGQITTVDYYLYDTYQYTEEYTYNEKGRLISVLNNGEHPHGNYYEWNDENVCKIRNILPDSNIHEYHDFCEHIDPEYTMPFVLFKGWTAQYGDGYLTKPLWKNWRKQDGTCKHKVDEDGYVTMTYSLDSDGDTVSFIHYVYSK
ncbi:MAG: hypothetical protein Q4F82_03790 [bacterium]|nr:hypothetical protein [bacterium]